jgi:hypothetical protein
MLSIYPIFLKLSKNKPTRPNEYFFHNIQGVKNHKIGISSLGLPMFFIRCTNSKKVDYSPYKLGIEVDFDRDCTITDGKKRISGKYTIITLKENFDSLIPYFLDMLLVVVKSLSSTPETEKVKEEIDSVRLMFSSLIIEKNGDIQGLWAELLVIEQASNPDFLISAWHLSKSDLIDFNDGEDKIEVKSTRSNDRIHTFSYHQLTPNKRSRFIIVSILVVKTGQGSTIFDLIESIKRRIRNQKLIVTLGNMVSVTLGTAIKKAKDVYFDYNSAVDSIACFDIKDIPNISSQKIPIEISNVHFDCNLSKTKRFMPRASKSKLFRAL